MCYSLIKSLSSEYVQFLLVCVWVFWFGGCLGAGGGFWFISICLVGLFDLVDSASTTTVRHISLYICAKTPSGSISGSIAAKVPSEHTAPVISLVVSEGAHFPMNLPASHIMV